jgi:hypothetical protein
MYNLCKLLNNYKVEIPIIQRDYAQGRENDKVARIRKDFVGTLLTAIQSNDGRQLHLDFIYGKLESQSSRDNLENNTNYVESILAFAKAFISQTEVSLLGEIPEVYRVAQKTVKSKLMPLDGQQRLTTLWLLHYVIYHKSGKEIPDWMDNFTYKTRKSSTAFIIGLLKHARETSNSITSDAIKKEKWFYKAWELDPTVKGMMVTINEIEKQINTILIKETANNEDHFIRWINKLESQKECVIEFSFLQLSDIDVEDDIYIKMNDRGKQLTDFEIFKNDLLAYLKGQSQTDGTEITDNDYQNIASNLDKIWLDLFWKWKDKNNFDVERSFYYFFLYHLLLYNISTNQKTDDAINSEYYSKLVGDKKSGNFEKINFKRLQELNMINENSLKFVFDNLNLLNSLPEEAQPIIDEMSFKKVVGNLNVGKDFLSHFLKANSSVINYYDRVYYYALIVYLLKFKDDFFGDKFKQWCRVIQNLIYNQAYIQGKDGFELAIRNVDTLLKEGNDINETLINNGENLSVFLKQRTEEIKKAKLIKKQSELYPLFLEMERHPYFNGQIDFLINLVKEDDNLLIDIIEWKSCAEKLAVIFQPEHLNDGNYLFARALLSNNLYFRDKGHKRLQFFSNKNSLRDKEEGFRGLFKKEPDLVEFKKILSKIILENWKNDLNDIIKDYKTKQWRYYFIKDPKLWSLGKYNMIKKTSDEDVRIWKTSRAYGKQYELRTKFYEGIWKDNLDIRPFEKIKYSSVKKKSHNPCTYFNGWHRNGNIYRLEVRYFGGSYQLKFFNCEKEKDVSIEDDIIDVLKELNYGSDDKKSYTLKIDMDNELDQDETMETKVKEALEKFNEIS